MRHHRAHLLPCTIAVATAAGVVVAVGTTPVAAALLVAAVACPAAMALVMWLLVRTAPTFDDRRHEVER